MAEQMKWYVNRLRSMTAEEIAFRLKFALKKRLWRRRKIWQASPVKWKLPEEWTMPSLEGVETAERDRIVEEAEAYVAGRYRMLNIEFTEPLPDWFLDPQSGRRAPALFGPDLNYRDPVLVGNVKNIWEKNRHHHLTVLALAYSLTGDRRYSVEVLQQLLSWTYENPFPLGINWTSSLEAGVRLISWVWVERLLRGTAEHDFLFGEAGMIWPSVYWHQWMIAEHYSYGSSSNNHLVGEMAGLYISSLVWPYFPESVKWRRFAKDILESEAVKQTYPGGINREQAFSYHIFSLEFFMLTGIEGDRYGDPFSFEYKDWIRLMLEVIPLVTDAGGNLPRYGDEDQGMALQLRSMRSSRLSWLYQLGYRWIGAAVPCETDEGTLTAEVVGTLSDPDRKASEYGGETVVIGRPHLARTPKTSDSGNIVLASRRGTPDEVFCLADAAPLGYLSIAGHGHADALSFALSVGGVPVIVDPGTYIYHAQPEWRSYFRGTKAHNTIALDGLDQSVAGGPFLWEKKANVTLSGFDTHTFGGWVEAGHDGYTRLSEPVTHKRKIELSDRILTLHDELIGKGRHHLDFRLHFAPHCQVLLDGEQCTAYWQWGEIKIKLDPRLQWRLLCGETDGGWYSPAFNVKQQTITLSGTMTEQVPVKIITIAEVKHED